MTHRIVRWDNGGMIWEGEAATFKDAVAAAHAAGKSLRRADLTGAVLRGAVLRRADLTGADLRGADLRGADLTGADLRGAVLRRADLTGADLTGADLRGADLTGADLRGAVLAGADLRGADLTGAVLTPIRDDLWAVLSSAPAEAEAVLRALREGRVDGSTYSGERACLVGTIANARHVQYTELPTLRPAAHRPAERFFLAIRKGDTPETNPYAKLAAEWIEDWIARMRTAFTPPAAGAASGTAT